MLKFVEIYIENMLKYKNNFLERLRLYMNNKNSYALVFGVSVFDICGFTDNNYRCNDSNPGQVKTSFGGVCRNIAECLKLIIYTIRLDIDKASISMNFRKIIFVPNTFMINAK